MNRHKLYFPLLVLVVLSTLNFLYGGQMAGERINGTNTTSLNPADTTPTLQPTEPAQIQIHHPLALPRVTYTGTYGELVDEKANTIIDDTGSLAPFLTKLAAARAGTTGAVNILHIGDSHVQAGFWDGRMREHFTRDFGTAGRGVILPHRLTGTNEPRDYYIRTWCPTEGYRVTSNPSGEPLGFTGTGVRFPSGAPGVEIWHKGGFDAITVHHHPSAPFLVPPDSLLLDMQCDLGDTPASTTYYLNRSVDTLRMEALFAPRDYEPLYYGFTLHGGATGVMYHAVGANSAAFEHFQRQTTIPTGGASAVLPDLIIVSLGTNNCFGRNYRSEGLRTVVARFFSSLKESYPDVPILITTPRESCKLQGGKRVPNLNIEDAARVITEEAARHGFASWDLYTAAGGRGIGETWYKQGLSGRDRIHLTESGYNLVGDMLYDAFIQYYNSFITSAGQEVTATLNSAAHRYYMFRQYNEQLSRGYLHTLRQRRTI